jgi:hypothetical protein
MAVVPFSPTAGMPTSPAVEKPSDTNLLMALAEMHSMGKFEDPSQPKPPRPPHKGTKR